MDAGLWIIPRSCVVGISSMATEQRQNRLILELSSYSAMESSRTGCTPCPGGEVRMPAGAEGRGVGGREDEEERGV